MAAHDLSIERYGTTWFPTLNPATKKPICPMPDWRIERFCYLNFTEENHPPGWLGKAEHFRRMISLIFASPVAKKPFQWNPNASRIVDEYFANSFLAIAGSGSSGKSEALAIIAVGEFISDPENTGILVTSTTLAESRGRIWGRIEYYWQEYVDYCKAYTETFKVPMLPIGDLVSSSGLIRYRNPITNRKDDTRGIRLVPGNESQVKDGIGRMKGFKARRLRFLADELSDLSHKLLEAAESNLFLNPDFKMVGCFNPASHFDPAGVFSEPIGGWSSINVLESDGWKTMRGYCIRFDGQASPNVVARKVIWEGLLTYDKLEDRRAALGDNSPRFMEQYRGCWSETGHADGIYSEAEIIKYMGMSKVEVWETPRVVVGGFDPSFVHGGDRCALVIGETGRGTCFGKFKPCVEIQKIIYLDDNIDTKQDKKELVLKRLKQACIEHKLDPSNLAMDATGGGNVFVTLMNRDPFFAHKFMAVGFGEQASELVMDGKKGKDRFVNRMSELWYAGKPLLMGGQIKGLKPDLIREMTLRLYEEQSGGKKRIKVESKEDMKSRLNGRSPDAADSFFLLLFVCRSKHGLKADGVVGFPKAKLEVPQADNPFAWGLKKKPKFSDDEAYAPAGGGWGDERGSDFGGMFG